MSMGAVYGQIENAGDEDLSLLSIKVDGARLAELHESIEIDGMMRMREITPFIVSAGETVELRPAGKHIMLMGLTDALTQGEKVELRVTFSDGIEVPVSAIIGGFGQMVKPETSD
jgi:copper(I)-binding protein